MAGRLDRGRDRQQTANAPRASSVGDTIGVATDGPVRQFTSSGVVELLRRRLNRRQRRSPPSTSRPRSSSFDKERPARHRPRRGQDGRAAGEARRGDQAAAAPDARRCGPPTSRDRPSDSSGLGFVRLHQSTSCSPSPGSPCSWAAFVIVEHALDHDRPARLASWPRSRTIGATSAAGSPLGARRGARDRPRRLGRRAGRSGSRSRSCSDALIRTIGIDLPQAGLVFSTRTVVVSLARRRRDHADREPAAGDAGDARPADRGGAGGLHAAAVTARALRPDHGGRRARARRSCCSSTASSPTGRDRRRGCLAGARRPAALLRASAERAAPGPAARQGARLARREGRRPRRSTSPSETRRGTRAAPPRPRRR